MDVQTPRTLREELEIFHRENKAYLSHHKKGISEEAKAFFRSHDIAHVLFGCDISLYGEGAVKIWTIFGTTLGFWNHIRGYNEANAFELAKHFGPFHILKNIFTLLFAIPTIIYRAKNMNKPWPWAAYETYLDQPIDQIRNEFNIQILQ